MFCWIAPKNSRSRNTGLQIWKKNTNINYCFSQRHASESMYSHFWSKKCFWTIIILESPENFSLPLLYRFYVKLPNDCYKFQEKNKINLLFFRRHTSESMRPNFWSKKCFLFTFKIREPRDFFITGFASIWCETKHYQHRETLNK